MNLRPTSVPPQRSFVGSLAPGALRTWSQRRRALTVVVVSLSAAATVSVALLGNPFLLQILTIALLNAGVTVALAHSFGFAGMFNLSQGSFYGIGAYTTAIALTDLGLNFFGAILLAVLVAGAFGVFLGFVATRLRGDYFAFASIAFTIVITQAIVNLPGITRGGSGFFGIPVVSVFGWRIESARDGFVLAAAAFVLVFTVTRAVTTSYLGRAMLAVNHDEMSARSMGVSPVFTRVIAMTLSAASAGLLGCILTTTVLFIQPNDFAITYSMNVTLWAIVGGPTSLIGSALAGGGITLLQEQLREFADIRLALLGIIVLFTVYLRGGVITLPSRKRRGLK